jgi:dGTPase
MNIKPNESGLADLLTDLNKREADHLSPAAARSHEGIRRRDEKQSPYRQSFALDADRILHSRAYVRYIDKTQVFSLVKNDHITHRVLHVQLVSRIARTVGRFLGLNEDLIEAIALGHDIGHPPFGHDGESFLSALCLEHGLPPFQHNVQSVRFLDRLERKGRGWNLTLQVLDGILCHDGEIHSQHLSPCPTTGFSEFDEKMKSKSTTPSVQLQPATAEGCVVRLSDTIAYIGKDIEDAIILGLIRREELPDESTKRLGSTNGTIVYNLVTDLISESRTNNTPVTISFSKETSEALRTLKTFNYEKIYLAPETKLHTPAIKKCYRELFEYYLKQLHSAPNFLPSNIDLMTDIPQSSYDNYTNEEKVRDFISGMTDSFFIRQAREIGCDVPIKQ